MFICPAIGRPKKFEIHAEAQEGEVFGSLETERKITKSASTPAPEYL